MVCRARSHPSAAVLCAASPSPTHRDNSAAGWSTRTPIPCALPLVRHRCTLCHAPMPRASDPLVASTHGKRRGARTHRALCGAHGSGGGGTVSVTALYQRSRLLTCNHASRWIDEQTSETTTDEQTEPQCAAQRSAVTECAESRTHTLARMSLFSLHQLLPSLSSTAPHRLVARRHEHTLHRQRSRAQ